jgi:hypothetical protein
MPMPMEGSSLPDESRITLSRLAGRGREATERSRRFACCSQAGARAPLLAAPFPHWGRLRKDVGVGAAS